MEGIPFVSEEKELQSNSNGERKNSKKKVFGCTALEELYEHLQVVGTSPNKEEPIETLANLMQRYEF